MAELRCAADTGVRARGWRANRDDTPGCLRSGKVKIHGRYYCYQHAPAWGRTWAAHDRMVKRIRSFPDRDIFKERR